MLSTDVMLCHAGRCITGVHAMHCMNNAVTQLIQLS